MICWQIASCTVSLQAPQPIVAAAAPLFTLYPTVASPAEKDICFTGDRSSDNRWSIHCNGSLLWQDEDIGNVIAALELALYRRVLAAITPEQCSIHAASFSVAGAGIICAGASGAGKSSVCTQALLAGARYLSDEFALLAKDGTIHPFSRPLQWEHPEHPAFSHDTMRQSELFDRSEYTFRQPDGKVRLSQLWLPRQLQRTPVPLTAVIFPRFVAGSPTSITPIPRSAAIIQLADLLHHRNTIHHNIRLLHQRIPSCCHFHTIQFGSVSEAWQQIALTTRITTVS